MPEAASPSLSEEVNPVFPEESVMASCKAAALKDTSESPQDLLQPHIFASRSRFKSQQAPEGKVQSMTDSWEVCHTSKDLHILLMYTDRNIGEYVWEWISRTWDNGRKSIILGQIKCVDMVPLNRDSRFNVFALKRQ